MASLTQQLAELLMRPVHLDDRRRASTHLLDWLGCAVYSLQSPPAEAIRRYLMANGGRGDCIALGGARYHWQDALLFNAALGNIAEMDDLHRASVIHPGPVVIPAALTVAEHIGADAQALLDAIVRGYEASIRIGSALGADHYEMFHNSSTCGSFGAAAAVASLLKLSGQELVWALGNAGTRTGGFWQLRHEQVMSKQFHTAEAAKSGVLAAMMAAQGFSGPAAILEGPQGLFAATSPQAIEAVVIAKSERWLLHSCSFKPWPACRHTHPSIDASRHLKAQIPSIADIEAIELGVYKDALVFCDRPVPSSENEAKFSLQHCTAVALLQERPELEHFLVENLHDDAVRNLRAKVSVFKDPVVDKAYRDHWGASIRIVLKDGSELRHQLIDAWGDPEWPMSTGDITAKATKLMASAGYAQGDQLSKAALALPENQSLEPLFEAMSGSIDPVRDDA